MRIRRSVLFAPADREDRALNCLSSPADVAVLDLEDGVSPDRKDHGREVVRRLMKPKSGRHAEQGLRVNPLGSKEFKEDLSVVRAVRPEAVVVPKAESPAAVRSLAGKLPRATALHLVLETARGVLRAEELARSSPKVQALYFGAEDLAADIGARRTRYNLEVLYARSRVALVAGAYRLQAIDQVYVDYRDLEGLRREAGEARDLGYRGKMCIHPGQVEVVHQVFTPTVEEVERARRVVEAAEQHGGGVFALDGRMVDRPLVEQARYVLEVARQSGLRGE